MREGLDFGLGRWSIGSRQEGRLELDWAELQPAGLVNLLELAK